MASYSNTISNSTRLTGHGGQVLRSNSAGQLSYDNSVDFTLTKDTVEIPSLHDPVNLYEIQMMYNFLIYKGYINHEEYETFKRQFMKLEEQDRGKKQEPKPINNGRIFSY